MQNKILFAFLRKVTGNVISKNYKINNGNLLFVQKFHIRELVRYIFNGTWLTCKRDSSVPQKKTRFFFQRILRPAKIPSVIDDPQLDTPWFWWAIRWFTPPRLRFPCNLRFDRSRLSLESRTAKISRMNGGGVCAGLFINNCWLFPGDRARTFDGETDRVIGVTVRSRRGFKREETRGKIKPMLPFPLHRQQPLRYQRYALAKKKERNVIVNKHFYFFSFFGGVGRTQRGE